MTKQPKKTDPVTTASRGRIAAREFAELNEAFDTVRFGFLEAIAQTKLGEHDARERLYLSVSVLDAVKDALVDVAANVSLAQHEDNIKRVMNGGR